MWVSPQTWPICSTGSGETFVVAHAGESAEPSSRMTHLGRADGPQKIYRGTNPRAAVLAQSWTKWYQQYNAFLSRWVEQEEMQAEALLIRTDPCVSNVQKDVEIRTKEISASFFNDEVISEHLCAGFGISEPDIHEIMEHSQEPSRAAKHSSHGTRREYEE